MPLADQQEDGDETDVSLITGALRSQNLLISEPAESSCGSSVVLRNQTLTVANTNTAGMLNIRRYYPQFSYIHNCIVEFFTQSSCHTCACEHFSKQQKTHFTCCILAQTDCTKLYCIKLHIFTFSFQHLS